MRAKKPLGTVTSFPLPTRFPFTKVPFKELSFRTTVGRSPSYFRSLDRCFGAQVA